MARDARGWLALAALLLSSLASAASADPCKAIPDQGPAPSWLRKGATFSGPVPYVGDGDSLCVDVGLAMGRGYAADGRYWVEVRLADFYAAELHEAGGPAAKAALQEVVRGKILTCTADHRSYDRIVAACTIGRDRLGDLLRRRGVPEGGRGVSPR